jgi:hypothetical protein
MAPIKTAGAEKMLFEIVIFTGTVFLAVTLGAKFVERRRDVLYGPYIQGRKDPFARFEDQLAQASTALHRNYARLAAKFATVSCLASAIIG